MRGRIPWEAQRPGRFAITDWEIEGRATALLLIDLQTAHVDPAAGAGPALQARYPLQAAYYYERLQNVVLANALALQAFFRRSSLPIVYACSGLALPDGRDLADWSWRKAGLRRAAAGIPLLLPPGAPGRELWPGLAPRTSELLLYKSTLSPFNCTALDQYLRNMGVENLVVAGVLTNGAVETTARNASDRGYNVILVEDACAALSPEDHEAGTAFASWHIVRSTQEVQQVLEPLVQQPSVDSPLPAEPPAPTELR